MQSKSYVQTLDDGDQMAPHKGPRAAGEDPQLRRMHKIGSDQEFVDLDSPKDPRSTSEKLSSVEHSGRGIDNTQTVKDPLKPAMSHGHVPSRGARIDADILAEEQEQLRRKGKI
ncbi:hypothetical protein H0H92_015952 [Tricholoma furcatifolium]|nr:hypothetical protein H0H92_015952 [Tricholoma furcatifolium]